MCGANRRFFWYLLLVLFFAFVTGVLRAGEPGPWYLISEEELQSIELYRKNSEAEKQNWLLQVNTLKTKAANSEARSSKLEQESAILNSQLSEAREANRVLTESFNRYEAGQLILASLKNGEIAGLKQTVADRTLEASTYKGTSRRRLVIIVALAGAWAIFIVFKIYRSFQGTTKLAFFNRH
jgi:hypothetical protein